LAPKRLEKTTYRPFATANATGMLAVGSPRSQDQSPSDDESRSAPIRFLKRTRRDLSPSLERRQCIAATDAMGTAVSGSIGVHRRSSAVDFFALTRITGNVDRDDFSLDTFVAIRLRLLTIFG